MKKIKSCIFLILTVLFSVSVFAFNAVPPDKGCLEVSQPPIILSQVEIFDLDTGIGLTPVQVTKEDKTVFSRVLSLDRGMTEDLNLLVPVIDKFAVVQNKNSERWQLIS